MRKILLFIALGILTQVISAQVYYSSDFTFYQSETNPSSVASSKLNRVIKPSFLYSPNYNQQAISGSIYFSKQFIGVGITANNTQVEQNNYKKIGVSVAYRNILFGKIKTRIGGHYKFIQNQSPKGIYSLYSFEEMATIKEKLSNANFSFSITDLANRFYLVGGKLNFNLFGDSQDNFKAYNYLTVGNLINRFNYGFRGQASYSIVQTKSVLGENINHVLTFANRVNISRKLVMLISGKLGYWNNSIYQIKPGIALYTPFLIEKVETLLKIAIDIGVNKFSKSLEYPPVVETIFQLKF